MSRAERYFDLVVAILLLPLFASAAAVIAVAIYLDSPGPVLYRSWRIGRHGRPFAMLKFRKMRREAPSHPVTLEDDARFTPIGRFLATTRLDELPQIYNVLRGEMRLVGPRPELECFVSEYADQYAEILTVMPGLTGRAQLRFLDERRLLEGDDPERSYRDIVLPEKIKIDIEYVRNHSLCSDVAILARTFAVPVALLLTRMRERSAILGVWLPTTATAVGLVLAFVLASTRLG